MQRANTFAQRIARDRVERTEGFVHQQQMRIVGESACHADALALSARQFVGQTDSHCRVEFDQFEQARNPAFGQALAHQPRADRDVLAHRHVREQADRLEDIADPAPQGCERQAFDWLALEQDGTPAWIDEPVDGLEQCGFARTRGPDQGHEFSRCDRQRHPRHGFGRIIAFADFAKLDQGLGGAGHAGSSLASDG